MSERRRWQRREIAWSARLMIGEAVAITVKAIDASRHGLRLVLDRAVAPAGLVQGQKCRVEIGRAHV